MGGEIVESEGMLSPPMHRQGSIETFTLVLPHAAVARLDRFSIVKQSYESAYFSLLGCVSTPVSKQRPYVSTSLLRVGIRLHSSYTVCRTLVGSTRFELVKSFDSDLRSVL